MKVIKVLQIDVAAALKNEPGGVSQKWPAWTLAILPPGTIFYNRTPDAKLEIFYTEEEGTTVQ